MPMPLSDIPSFEKCNHCSINVYQLEHTKLVSVYHSKNRKGRYRIDLLRLLENKDSHCCLIKKNSNLLHFLTWAKSKQNKGPISRFWRNCFQPIVKKILQKACILLPKECPTWDSNVSRVAHTWVCELGEDSKVPVGCVCWSGSNQGGKKSLSQVNSRTREIERQQAVSFGSMLVDFKS